LARVLSGYTAGIGDGFAVRILQTVQIGVKPTTPQQFIVRALINDLAVIHHHNFMGTANG
jgi:hypothetical protein